MQETKLYDDIRAEIESIPLIDTHEHILSEKTRLSQKIDLFSWFDLYAAHDDLVSAGLPRQSMGLLVDIDKPLDERWADFTSFWKYTRTTGYGRVLLLAARDLFDIPDINETTYQELSKKISAANRKGWYQHVLKERANIDLAILNLLAVDPIPLEEVDHHFFTPVVATKPFLEICNLATLEALEHETSVAINSLDDLLKAMDVTFQRAVSAGVVGIKVDVAYYRSLHFERVTKADAERVFNQLKLYPLLGVPGKALPSVSWKVAKPLQDYLMHLVVHRAIELNLPIQLHTGFQAGNGNFLVNSHPLHLVNLLIEYPDARFILFHAGYPYQSEMATLGKCFPNVYVDMCWLYAISPWVARQTLHEWIETVPANKIFAFGGDYNFVEAAYAHARIARDNLSKVLAEKVETGYLTEDEAVMLAHQMLHDNALQLYHLPV